MTPPAIIRRIMLEQEKLEIIKGRITAMKQELIAAACPVREGDIVTIDGRYCSHRGKQMEVRHIYVLCGPLTDKPTGFRISGLVLKKDGTPGTHVGRYEIDLNID